MLGRNRLTVLVALALSVGCSAQEEEVESSQATPLEVGASYACAAGDVSNLDGTPVAVTHCVTVPNVEAKRRSNGSVGYRLRYIGANLRATPSDGLSPARLGIAVRVYRHCRGEAWNFGDGGMIYSKPTSPYGQIVARASQWVEVTGDGFAGMSYLDDDGDPRCPRTTEYGVVSWAGVYESDERAYMSHWSCFPQEMCSTWENTPALRNQLSYIDKR